MVPIDAHMQLDPEIKKRVLRMFTYGLYAVGVASGEERAMFTANWLSQVSFDPPLIAVSVENDSHSIGLLRKGRLFAVSVFASTDRERAGLLGRRFQNRPEKMDLAGYRLGQTGCPILQDALGAVECHVIADMPAGDSTVFIGEVVNAEGVREGQPLTMSEAGFRHSG